MRDARLWRAAALVALVAAAAIVVTRFRVESDVTHFLPDGRLDPDVELARELAFGELSRTMVLLVTVPPGGDAAAVSEAFEHELRNEPAAVDALEFLEGGPPPGTDRALWDLYHPRRFAFAARDADAARDALAPEGLAAAARRIADDLASPLSSVVTPVAPSDPFLALPRLMERLEEGRAAGLAVDRGRFVTADGGAAVLFAATRAPSSDNAAQRPVLAGIRRAFERIDRERFGDVALSIAGANRHGLAVERDMRADVQRVAIGSALLLIVGLGALFGSLRLFLLVAPVVASGLVVGTAACLVVYGSVHAMTLAFGAALIGVSVDYAVHLHTHHVVSRSGATRALRELAPALSLSAATTIVGLGAMAFAGTPGLAELAVFGAAGIAAALGATFAFVPVLEARMPAAPRAERAARALEARVARAGSPRGRGVARAVLLVAVAFAAAFAPGARFRDDLAGLGRLDPELLAEDAAVRGRVARFDQSTIAVAVGEDDEAALSINDRIGDALAAARASGEVDGYWSAASFLPSARRQREVDQVLRGDATLADRMDHALEAAGLVPRLFAPFRAALAEPPPKPLGPEDFEDTALESWLRPLRVQLDDRVAYLTYVRGAKDAAAIGARIEAAGGRWIDVQEELGAAYGGYRRRMGELFLVGFVCVVALVLVRNAAARRAVLRPTMLAVAPAALAAATTIALFTALGWELNLLSLVALLLVVAMGVDYGVVVAETERGGASGASRLSVAVAALSSASGFALLAMSQQPSLRGLGAVAAVGVLLAVAFVTILSIAMAPRGQEKRVPGAGASATVALAFALLLPALGACCSSPPRERPPPAFVGELLAPRDLGAEVLWQQTVSARWREREDTFDAAVQVRGDELLVLGLSPLGRPGFELRLVGADVSFVAHVGEMEQLEPRHVLLDVQQVFFPWLDGEPPADGERRGERAGRVVHERWREGRLVERRIAPLERQEAIARIEYDWSGGFDLAPARARLVHELFGYELSITTHSETRLDGVRGAP